MAISGNTVWEVRPTNGSDNNGGGFVAGASGTDFSQQNAAQYSFTDLASTNGNTASPQVTSASHSFVAADVGNLLHITAGTNWTQGFYQIVSVATGAATLDRAVGSAATLSAGSYSVGGALATIPKFNSNAVAGNLCWVKAESTISISSGINLNFGAGGAVAGQLPGIFGYSTTRGDGGKVTIQASAINIQPMITLSTQGVTFANFILDGNNLSGTRGISLSSTSTRCMDVDAKNCSTFSFQLNNPYTQCIRCTSTNCTGSSGTNAAFTLTNNGASILAYCTAYSNSIGGFGMVSNSPTAILIGCISANNSGSQSDGFALQGNQGTLTMFGCVAYNNGRDGFRIQLGQWGTFNFFNNVSYGNAAWGFNQITGTVPNGIFIADYSGYGGNASGNLNALSAGTHDVTLTTDPFTSGATNDLSLNNTAGGGAALRAAGYPGSLPAGGSGHVDIGALQHQDSGGGSTFIISPNITRVFQEGEV